MPRKKKRRSKSLVTGFLERISRKLFSDFPESLTDIVSDQSGVYALYKNDQLFYVGLAEDLKRRIKQHLKDKHAGSWSKFSLYLVRKPDHIKELETIIQRVSTPKGNVAQGRLPSAVNLRRTIDKHIKLIQNNQRTELLGQKQRSTRSGRKRKWARRNPASSLKTGKRFSIRAKFKGKEYKAVVLPNGIIDFNGNRHTTLSSAAKVVTGVATRSGWTFWKYKKGKNIWANMSDRKQR
jgi:Restriction Enzyme Adenine Methylase Associated/GIY-YIG catalytic domain